MVAKLRADTTIACAINRKRVATRSKIPFSCKCWLKRAKSQKKSDNRFDEFAQDNISKVSIPKISLSIGGKLPATMVILEQHGVDERTELVSLVNRQNPVAGSDFLNWSHSQMPDLTPQVDEPESGTIATAHFL